jgi:hypothetical protein
MLAILLILMILPTPLMGQSLQGSRASMDAQVREADRHGFTRLRNPTHVRGFVVAGILVPVRSSRDLTVLPSVSHPYARPEVQLFLTRLSAQYRAACGERLVVTSLTRPLSSQPRNASPRSVHPTGMAVDLRVPQNRQCRQWLERVLLQLEGAGVLEATRENNPPHYHIAVYPRQYNEYVNRLNGNIPNRRR